MTGDTTNGDEQDAAPERFRVRLLRGRCELEIDGELTTVTTTYGALLTYLLALRTGPKESATVAECSQVLGIPSPSRRRNELHNRAPWLRETIENRARQGSDYYCNLAVKDVDVLYLSDGARQLLDKATWSDEDFAQARKLLDLYQANPTLAFVPHLVTPPRKGLAIEEYLKRVEKNPVSEFADPFRYLKDSVRELFQVARRHAPDATAVKVLSKMHRRAFDIDMPDAEVAPDDRVRPKVDVADHLVQALRDVGVIDAIGALAGSYLDPEYLLDLVTNQLDFVGHTASKLRQASGFRPMLDRLSAEPDARVRLLLEAADARDEEEVSKELRELQKEYSGLLEVRYYDSEPLLRITHVDQTWLAVQTYPPDHKKGQGFERGALVFSPKGDDSFYQAFVRLFEETWNDPETTT